MSGGVDRRFPRALRLRKSADFVRVQRAGRRLEVSHLVVRYRPNQRAEPRFGLAVGRKVGNAVARNRVKRAIREAVRQERGSLGGVDVVFIARPSAARAGSAGIHEGVSAALQLIRSRLTGHSRRAER
ncbi:MAG: ribonuclease P protein component [Deltaproteobacteria bacterium]|nr:ribonuclease P protein component [Deltaproteobacteria bacterium]